MESLVLDLQSQLADLIKDLYSIEVAPINIPIQETKKDFEGDYTVVIFPLSKYRLGAPEKIGNSLGEALVEKSALVNDFNVIKGFLNLVLSDQYWLDFLGNHYANETLFSRKEGDGQTVVVEFCSPNTNKPLHLGHLRNIILGDSLTRILEANGYQAIPVCLFNDRGTNISKSMYAWLQAGKHDTPESTGKKGDKLVGDYYVEYSKAHKAELEELVSGGMDKELAVKSATTTKAIQEMTVKWEAGEQDIRSLWERMNGWVYEAMEDTFRSLGVAFDQYYYESQVYQKGKETVEEGLNNGVFFQKEDGSVWIDLSEDGLDQKLVLRKDGTSVYITQDLAIADAKYQQYGMDKSIYVVGNEQDYHFKVLFLILKKLGKSYAEGLFHLSYGMVDLPSGKMKSREGTTVEADDLLEEIVQTAREAAIEHGKTAGMNPEEVEALHKTIALGALKYFLVKVDPKKRMLFNPKESVDIFGHTGPFIQYAYTRTVALARKAGEIMDFDPSNQPEQPIHLNERLLMRRIAQYPSVLKEAGDTYNPALIANFVYELAKDYNRFYHGDKIIQEGDTYKYTSAYRLALSTLAGNAMKNAMNLLGIQMPDRM